MQSIIFGETYVNYFTYLFMSLQTFFHLTLLNQMYTQNV